MTAFYSVVSRSPTPESYSEYRHDPQQVVSQPRMEGSDVERLQEALKEAGITVGVDGEFEPGTDKAVKEFQAKKTLTADGIVGAKTLTAM